MDLSSIERKHVRKSAFLVNALVIGLFGSLSIAGDSSFRMSMRSAFSLPSKCAVAVAPIRSNKAAADVVLTDKENEALESIVGVVKTGQKHPTFKAGVPGRTRQKIGDGSEIISVLEPHLDLESPTALRVEEKAVVTNQHADAFLDRVQVGENIRLELRDARPEGQTSRTVTVYGRPTKVKVENGKVELVVKPRMRKYFNVPNEKLAFASAHESVFGEHVMFELKISTSQSRATETLLGIEGTVFKPRITINDEIANKLQKLNGEDAEFAAKLAALKEKVVALVDAEQKPLNSTDKITSFFAALELLGASNPLFLQPDSVVVYERSSYRAKASEGEYQFTIDRNTKIFEARHEVDMKVLPRYLTETPIYEALPDEVFIELKSPPKTKRTATPLYSYLHDALVKDHLKTFELGGGKFSLGRGASAAAAVKEIDRSLLTEGLYYWLVKGVGNLPRPPKRKDIVENGLIDVAIPFTSTNGQVMRVIFKYEPFNDLQGNRTGVLTEVVIADAQGQERNVEGSIKSIASTIGQAREEEVFSLVADGKLIPFVKRISPETISQFQKFFLAFYANPTSREGNLREIEDIHKIHSKRQLDRKLALYRAQNSARFVVERTKRAAVGAIVMTTASYIGSQIVPPLVERFMQDTPAQVQEQVIETETQVPFSGPRLIIDRNFGQSPFWILKGDD